LLLKARDELVRVLRRSVPERRERADDDCPRKRPRDLGGYRALLDAFLHPSIVRGGGSRMGAPRNASLLGASLSSARLGGKVRGADRC